MLSPPNRNASCTYVSRESSFKLPHTKIQANCFQVESTRLLLEVPGIFDPVSVFARMLTLRTYSGGVPF